MAVIQASKTTQPTTINKFLGLNLSNTGDTQIALGESGNMTNFYITDDLKLRKMHGYKAFHQFVSPIKGLFSAKIKNKRYLFVASGGNLYSFDENKLIDSKVNPEKKDLFIADGNTDTFTLTENHLTSVEKLKIGKSTITEFTPDPNNVSIVTFPSTTVEETTYPSGSINITLGKLVFDTNPADKTNIVINYIQYLEASNLGSIGTGDASFFEFDNKVYILCGEYWVCKDPEGATESDRLARVKDIAYVPTVFVNTPPAGGGTIYDEINMLTPKKKQEFNGDNASTTYQLAQDDIDSVVKVEVGITTYTEVENNPGATEYTVNKTDGTVTFGSAPPSGYGNVIIEWSKTDVGNLGIIEGMKYGTVFGGDVDTRVFLYGNSSCQNRVYFSGTTFQNGIAVPSAEYFPATAQVDIGPSNFAVTDLTRQYDRLLATTNKPEAYYLTLSTEQLSVTLGDGSSTTRYVPSVSTFPLNQAHGNVAMGQGQLIMNYPATFEDGAIVMWKATNVRDEKNAEIISQRIALDLDKIPMHSVKTFDLQEKNQLWVIYDKKAWIYNYENKTYSRLEFPDTMTHICSLNGNIYMSTDGKNVIKFSEAFTTYGNNPTSLNTEEEAAEIEEKIKIKAYWEMNFSDFGVPYLRKTMSKLWVSLQPQNWTSCEVSFISNRLESTIKKQIEYKKQWFDNVNFADFHFTSSVNPQPFRLKLKAKKFTNLKITIRNEEKSTCTVLALVLQVESFGYSK